jgi:hypothetical protein
MQDQPREHLLGRVERQILTGTLLFEIANEPQRVAVIENAGGFRIAAKRLEQLAVGRV